MTRSHDLLPTTSGLNLADEQGRFYGMATPQFDFSVLSAAERIQLAEDLWNSVDPSQVTLSAVQLEELDRRREHLRREGSRGRPWRTVLEELKQRGR